ncbi:MAG: alpha/beta fold hydrolase, partial [Casimicrobium sp.]
PIPRRWRAGLLSFSQLTGLAYRYGPAPIANSRRDRWRDRNEARAHFASKAFVQRWASGVLGDFLAHAIVERESGTTLAIPRASERDIYANIVHAPALNALRKARAAGVEVHFIAGSVSEELRLAGRDGNRALFSPNYLELEDIGHLIPFEAPSQCARAVLDSLTRSS